MIERVRRRALLAPVRARLPRRRYPRPGRLAGPQRLPRPLAVPAPRPLRQPARRPAADDRRAGAQDPAHPRRHPPAALRAEEPRAHQPDADAHAAARQRRRQRECLPQGHSSPGCSPTADAPAERVASSPTTSGRRCAECATLHRSSSSAQPLSPSFSPTKKREGDRATCSSTPRLPSTGQRTGSARSR